VVILLCEQQIETLLLKHSLQVNVRVCFLKYCLDFILSNLLEQNNSLFVQLLYVNFIILNYITEYLQNNYYKKHYKCELGN